jgi:hypothetical protein
VVSHEHGRRGFSTVRNHYLTMTSKYITNPGDLVCVVTMYIYIYLEKLMFYYIYITVELTYINNEHLVQILRKTYYPPNTLEVV